MLKYEIDVPGQGKFEVDSPTDLTDAQAYAAVQAQLKGAAPAEPTQDTGLLSMTGRAIARGAKQTGSLIGDILPAMAASAVGADEYAARQMEEAAQTQREIEQKYGARYKSLEDVKGIGDYIPFALETVAEQIPGMATALIPGAGLGVAGGRMAATAAAKKLAEREATEAGARYAAMKTAQGVGRGQIGGTFLGSYALNAPEVFQNIYEETGQMEPAAAALAGSVSAALDSILPVAILRQMGPNVKAGVVENLLEKSGMPSQLARKVVGSAATGAGTEGLNEGAQEAISIAAEKFVQENPEVWGSKEFNRLVESSVRGAVGGGAFGAAGDPPNSPASGGSGGGGRGATFNVAGALISSAQNGTANTGGGAGGGYTSGTTIPTGGSGIVILKYTAPTQSVFTFKGSGSWVAPTGVTSVDYLVVAGGGGGSATYGAGGAGGYRTSTQTVAGGTVITVTVGDGGAGGSADPGITRGTSGSDSSISGSGLTTITSAGGGGGGSQGGNQAGINGGSGGGASGSGGTGGNGNTPSTSPSQGNNGGNGSVGAVYGTGGGD